MSKRVLELLLLECLALFGGLILLRIGSKAVREKSIGRPPRAYTGRAAQVWGALYILLGVADWVVAAVLAWFWAHGKVAP
jgi:hypothetical protein